MIPTSNNIFGARSKTFKTRWNIGAGETIYLPLVSGGTYNMFVEWGDGSSSTITAYTSNTHTYTNSGTYDICITGVCSLWSFGSVATSNAKIIAVLNWGDVGFTSMSSVFQNCSNLASIAPYAPNVDSFAWAFAGCALTEIPANLFKKCLSATSMVGVLCQMSGLTSIPAGLFDNCPLVTSFYYAFRAGSFVSIPAGLFDNCPLVTTYELCFNVCITLTGNAPELWNLAPEPTGTNCFGSDTSLTNYADIPADWK